MMVMNYVQIKMSISSVVLHKTESARGQGAEGAREGGGKTNSR